MTEMTKRPKIIIALHRTCILFRPSLFPLRAIIVSIACLLNYVASGQTMKVEADRFLAGMPEGLQLSQERAVREAINGDTSQLERVRASRNNASPLPYGVEAIDISTQYRLYFPATATDARLPLLIYLHGGGWCFGSINSCAVFCGALAHEAGIAVLAVDYPLAPEHPYPDAIESCIKALLFVSENAEKYGINPESISLGGDSAGGNLALATALVMANPSIDDTIQANTSITLKSLVLFYPVVRASTDHTPSWLNYATGFGLNSAIMDAFNQAYTGRTDPSAPLISPLCAPLHLLATLPPTLIVNAERDILCDQGKEMYTRLLQAGVDTRREVFEGAVHLFITVDGQPAAFHKAVTLATGFLSK